MQPGPVEIRDARPADAPALADLLGELGYPESGEVIAARLESLQAAGKGVLIATRGAGPVGLVTVHFTPVLHRPTPVGRLTALIVTRSERGRGVGRALVAAGERWLAARGCALVEVTSNRRRGEAHAFYRRLGYEETSLRFKKDLTPG